MNDSKRSAKNVAYLGVSLALLEASKLALNMLPNIELVTLLFIIFTIFYGRNTFLLAVGFIAIECFVNGVSAWTLMYLYIWPLLIVIVLFANRHKAGYIFYCILSGLFGLFFGTLCTITYLFVGGWSMAVTWWISGLTYDVIHGVSNFIQCLLLFKPLCTIMRKVTPEW